MTYKLLFKSGELIPLDDLAISHLGHSEQIERAIKAERERCATVARDRHLFWHSKPAEHNVSCDVTACEDIANEIMKGDA